LAIDGDLSMMARSVNGIRYKSPNFAALISAFIIGSGHVYVGKWRIGGLCMVVTILLACSIVYFSHPWPIFPLAILWYWQIWDSFRQAEIFNDELLCTEKRPW